MRVSPLLLVVLLLAGCSQPGPDADTVAIQGVLAHRVQAINNKDLELYGSLIAEEYRDSGATREQLIERMAGYFKRFDSIQLDYWDTEIEHDRGRARVSQRISLQVGGIAEPMVDGERLLLEKIQGRWVITGGL